jgi:hypothetical protein
MNRIDLFPAQSMPKQDQGVNSGYRHKIFRTSSPSSSKSIAIRLPKPECCAELSIECIYVIPNKMNGLRKLPGATCRVAGEFERIKQWAHEKILHHVLKLFQPGPLVVLQEAYKSRKPCQIGLLYKLRLLF